MQSVYHENGVLDVMPVIRFVIAYSRFVVVLRILLPFLMYNYMMSG